MQITAALPLEKGMRLSFVGGGGKTSLIFALATQLASLGHTILVTTTTAIFHPGHGNQPYDQLVIGDINSLCHCLPQAGQIVVAAKHHDPKSRKLAGFSPQALARVHQARCFDFILIEADGSKRLPVKAPADHEPVIPAWTDMVIGCIGLDCLDRPMNGKTVHRPEIFSTITKQPLGDPIQSDHILSLVAADQGLFKNTSNKMQKIVCFNKADTKERVQRGKVLAGKVLKECPQVKNCLVTCLLDSKNPISHTVALDKRSWNP